MGQLPFIVEMFSGPEGVHRPSHNKTCSKAKKRTTIVESHYIYQWKLAFWGSFCHFAQKLEGTQIQFFVECTMYPRGAHVPRGGAAALLHGKTCHEYVEGKRESPTVMIAICSPRLVSVNIIIAAFMFSIMATKSGVRTIRFYSQIFMNQNAHWNAHIVITLL